MKTMAAAQLGLILMLLSAFVAGCETPPGPYVPNWSPAPKVIHCNDYTGHKAGAKPWIFGGTCCCTPGDELMKQLHRDGFCAGMTSDDLREAYEKAGIRLCGPGHERCAGLCPDGPHVVLGGKCMCPPPPGTEMYEKVIFAPARTDQAQDQAAAVSDAPK